MGKKKELLLFLHGEPKKASRNSNFGRRLSELNRRFGREVVSECESEGLIAKLTINNDPVITITPKGIDQIGS